jgi:two-component sensor histidine kinase
MTFLHSFLPAERWAIHMVDPHYKFNIRHGARQRAGGAGTSLQGRESPTKVSQFQRLRRGFERVFWGGWPRWKLGYGMDFAGVTEPASADLDSIWGYHAPCWALLFVDEGGSRIFPHPRLLPSVPGNLSGLNRFRSRKRFFSYGLKCPIAGALLARWGGDPGHAQYNTEHWLSLGLFVGIGFALAAVSEGLRLGWERAIKAEEQKAILLRELQHRTKNEFALAAAMLRLQAKVRPSAELQAALDSAIGRIEAFGRSHEEFDLPDSGVDIPMRPYLEGLCASLSAQAAGSGSISIRVVAEDITLPPKHANTIGLVANELLTNAYKHAFESETAGNVAVTLHRSKTRLTLTVEDDGRVVLKTPKPASVHNLSAF